MIKKLLIPLLAISNIAMSSELTFPKKFEFGVASAAVHVEDQIDTIWTDFGKAGKVAAYNNINKPEDKLQFWTKPEIELDLAKELGVKVFRLGIDWQRLVPISPFKTNKKGIQNHKALQRYIEIMKMIKKRGMKVMLTLFHHSEPKWAMELGGWKNPKLIKAFEDFATDSFDALNPYVDYWLTFNEPNVYMMFSRVVGNWPPGKQNFFGAINLPFYKGEFFKALDNIATSHNNFYTYAHSKSMNVKVSIAHNTAFYRSGGLGGEFISNMLWENMNYYFPDLVKDHLDFMGFNYYGSEYVSVTGLQFLDHIEYNDAGRAVDPDGFYEMIKRFHKRYKLPIYITENGTADEDDFIRPHYLSTHLKAIHRAISENIPVLGYIQWTLTDNFEWADGYCPKFGIVAVDRKTMKRTKRDSFYLYKNIISTHSLTDKQMIMAKEKYTNPQRKHRKMCRDLNGKDGLDKPRIQKHSPKKW